jgi:hypothetical protein
MAVVLVEFPCSFDGIASETMVVGSQRDFGAMTPGLVGLGWISEDPAAREIAIEGVPEVKAEVVDEVPPEVPPAVDRPVAAEPPAKKTRRTRR